MERDGFKRRKSGKFKRIVFLLVVSLPVLLYGQDELEQRRKNVFYSDEYEFIKDIKDNKSFKDVDRYYAKDKNYVYYKYVCNIGSGRPVYAEMYFLIKDADPKTFKVMKNKNFSYDQHNVYYQGVVLPDADLKTFKPFSSTKYSKDAKHIYFENKKLDGADINSFTIVSDKNFDYYDYAYDKNYLYFHHDRTKIDIETFIKCPKLMDKNASYSFGSAKGKKVIGVSVHNKIDRVMSPITENKTDLIKDMMDEGTFQEINKYYAKDSRHVYFNHIRIEIEPRVPLSRYVETYFVIEGADPETFRLLTNDNIFSVDKNLAFYKGFAIDSASSQGFTPFGELYSKDNYNVYYKNRKLEGADLHTFTVVYCYNDVAAYNDYAYDKNYLYSGNTKMKIDIETFVVDHQTKRCKDKNYHYSTTHSTIRIRERKEGNVKRE